MKKSDYCYIFAVMLMFLAIFIQSHVYPNLAYALRIITFVAGLIVLIASGMFEYKESSAEPVDRDKPYISCSRSEPDGRKNYSSDFAELYEKYCKKE